MQNSSPIIYAALAVAYLIGLGPLALLATILVELHVVQSGWFSGMFLENWIVENKAQYDTKGGWIAVRVLGVPSLILGLVGLVAAFHFSTDATWIGVSVLSGVFGAAVGIFFDTPIPLFLIFALAMCAKSAATVFSTARKAVA